ncbi:hypothetical protein [Lewinella cohaerens]|uniref:hypothetical protein n=1 Tax=Lewinella cohaerens TaxID=70995 RepID=UPI0003761848|nr:hypothetical protein [Lewinella cohaerens]
MAKRILYLLLPVLLLCACTEPIVRQAPVVVNETVSLGFFAFADGTPNFTPYYDKRTLVFENEDGLTYTFQMNQPILQSEYSYLKTFPHPDRSGEFIDYRYAGNRASFEFVCTELGAKLVVALKPELCEDPQLNPEILPVDFLEIRGIGFNDGDVNLRDPALAVDIKNNRPCPGGRRLGNITLGGREFSNVTSERQELGNRYFEVYYSPEEGIVAFGTTYLFLVLKEAY